ncbi:MAG: hypothetical protein SynsKO_44030 [Synoicihabitans sp.]
MRPIDAIFIVLYGSLAAFGIWLYFKAVRGGPSETEKKKKIQNSIGWLVCGSFYSFAVGFAVFFLIMLIGPGRFMNLDGHNAKSVEIGNSVAAFSWLAIFVLGALYSIFRAVKCLRS